MSDGGFVYRRRYRWVDYPEAGADDAPVSHQPDYVGFRVEILANPTGGEVEDEAARWRDVLKGKVPMSDYLESVAYRVRAWNYQAEDLASGEIADVPAPAAGEWRTFHTLPNDLMFWVVVQARQAHLPKAMTKPRTGDAGTTATATPSDSTPAETPLDD